MIWAKEETLPRQEIENIQLTRLKSTLKRIYDKIPAYRAKMDQQGISCKDIKNLDDLKLLPFTKQDL